MRFYFQELDREEAQEPANGYPPEGGGQLQQQGEGPGPGHLHDGDGQIQDRDNIYLKNN